MPTDTLVTGWIDPYPVTEIVEMPYPRNRRGIYYLFGGQSYEGETHIGVYECLRDAFEAFDFARAQDDFYDDDWATIYVMGNGKLVPYLKWLSIQENNTIYWAWRKAEKE